MSKVRGLVFFSITPTSAVCPGTKGKVPFDGTATTVETVAAVLKAQHGIDRAAVTVKITNERFPDKELADDAPLPNYTSLEVHVSKTKVDDASRATKAIDLAATSLFGGAPAAAAPAAAAVAKRSSAFDDSAALSLDVVTTLSMLDLPLRRAAVAVDDDAPAKCALCGGKRVGEVAADADCAARCGSRAACRRCFDYCADFCSPTVCPVSPAVQTVAWRCQPLPPRSHPRAVKLV
jgi:hypothetical protein